MCITVTRLGKMWALLPSHAHYGLSAVVQHVEALL